MTPTSPQKFGPAGHPGCAPDSHHFLLPYQAAWVKDTARLKLAEKARQVGWSWATAYSLVARKALRGAALDAWISSRDEIQARLFLEDCRTFAGILNLSVRDLGERLIDASGNSAFVLRLANRRSLHSMSSSPDAQAGKRGDRVLDEFALHPDPRQLYAIAYPGITWGGSLEIFSTHRGSGNYFNQLIEEIRHKGNPKGFSLHRVTLQDALEQGFLAKLKAKLPRDDPRQEMDDARYFDFIREGCPDAETFQQEYCCLPSDDQSAFLSYDLIAGCEYKPEEVWQAQASNSDSDLLYLGVDVGRDHDLTVLWVLQRMGDVFFTRAVECLQNETFDAQEKALYAWLQRPAVQRCCIDATGIGRQFCERAGHQFGSYRVEAVQFTGPVKEQLAYPLRAAFEARTLRIPDDSLIRADLRAIKKETTLAGNIRFTADRGKNGHADRFWALALALHAASTAVTAGPIHVFTDTRIHQIIQERRQRWLDG